MRILAIETSCDETACAVVKDGMMIISNVVATSAEMHQKYGGIVPEVAARRQLESILPVITEALHPITKNGLLNQPLQGQPLQGLIQQSVDAIAVTVGPGLIGSLLIGVETAKTIALATGLPIIPVNHVLAHMYANFINKQDGYMAKWLHGSKTIHPSDHVSPAHFAESRRAGGHPTILFPAISLVVSGGHTELYLMKSAKKLQWLGGTLDDAAGECFDKTARLLGFGNGGGAAIQEAATKGKGQKAKGKIILPRPMMHDESLNFSFSGLKTAVLREWQKHNFQKATPSKANPAKGSLDQTELVNAFAYEVQEAITDVLVTKTLRAARQYEAKSILLSGGVAANIRLREKFLTKLRSNELTKLSFHAPPPQLCTDNAVYIASYAYFCGKPTDWHEVTAIPDLSVEL